MNYLSNRTFQVFLVVFSLGFFGCSSEADERVGTHLQAATAQAWATGSSYQVGDLVSYDGKIYRAVQAHGAQPGWEPPNVAALWAYEGEDDGGAPESPPSGPVNGLTLRYITEDADCNEFPSSCCELGSTEERLTSGDDVFHSTQPNRCVIADAGRDTVFLASSGPSSLILGAGDDTAMGGPGNDLIWGGFGRDTINGYGGTNLFFGGHGSDTIMAANGENTVVPGPGRDTVQLGSGDDSVYIFDACEIAEGEVISGGSGHDKLYVPVPLSELQALGLSVSGFEEVIVEDNRCRSECTPDCSEGLTSSGANIVRTQLRFPKGTDLAAVASAAATELVLEDGATVGGLEDRLVTVAQGSARLASGTEVPSLVVAGETTISSGANVRGDVRTTDPAVVEAGAVVEGQVLAGQPLSPPDEYAFSMVFVEPTDGSVLIRPGRSQIVWPGNYRGLRVQDGGKLYLESGLYSFEDVTIEEGAELIVETEDGPVNFHVKDSLSLLGKVSGLGGAESDFVVGFGGDDEVIINGSFAGALLAPLAEVAVAGGTHDAFLYGAELTLSGGAEISTTGSPWVDGFDDKGDVVMPPIPSDVRGGTLTATEDTPGSLTVGGGFDFTIPGRLRVTAGNAENLPATLSVTTTSGQVTTCDYRGGASSSSPLSFLEKARGRFYNLLSCSGGVSEGDELDASNITLSISGDPNLELGTTVTLGAGDSCGHVLGGPIDPIESRQMIEGFSWDDASAVPERTADGQVALYYANIYLENQEDLDNARRLLIHTQDLPLFHSEMEDYKGKCGTVGLEGDGEGVFLFAVLPGTLYNALIDLRSVQNVPEEEREIFRAVILRQPPVGAANPDGSLSYESLARSNFLYMGLSDLPPDEAIDQQVSGFGSAEAFVSALEWVGEATRDVVREVIVFVGELERLFFGSSRATIDLDVRNTDSRFASNVMTRAWGNRGAEIAPEGALATLTTLVGRFAPGPLPLITAHKARVNAIGRAFLDAPDGDSLSEIEVVSLCYELKNDATRFTSFLTNDRICHFGLDKEDFNDFRSDHIEVPFHWRNRSAALFSEITDSYEYVRQVAGFQPERAYVARGALARVFTGTAFAGCFRLGNITVDAARMAALHLQPVVGTALTILSNNDIFFSPNDLVEFRGVATHEYGHFFLCNLSSGYGKLLDDVSRTFDTIAAGSLDEGDETRVINEAFADFFMYQVAGGVNYFPIAAGLNELGYTSFPTGPGSQLGPFAMDVNQSILGWTNTRLPQFAGFYAVTQPWIVSILQDLFDGRPHSSGVFPNPPDPTNGDAWSFDSSSDLINGLRTDGDRDEETVALDGHHLVTLADRFFGETNVLGTYRYAALETGIVKTMDEAGVTWCDQCVMLLEHYVDNSSGFSRKRKLEECLSGRLRQLIGAPARQLESLNGLTCEPCPPGAGMAPDGTCTACGADVVVDWQEEALGNCGGRGFARVTSSTDVCPSTFVVDVLNADGTFPVVSVGAGQPDLVDAAACAASRVALEVQSGNLFSPLTSLSSQSESGTSCSGLGCSSSCQYLSSVPVPESGRVRLISSASPGDVTVSLSTECSGPR